MDVFYCPGTCASALQPKEKGRPLSWASGARDAKTCGLKPHSHLQARRLNFSRPLARVCSWHLVYCYCAHKGAAFDSSKYIFVTNITILERTRISKCMQRSRVTTAGTVLAPSSASTTTHNAHAGSLASRCWDGADLDKLWTREN